VQYLFRAACVIVLMLEAAMILQPSEQGPEKRRKLSATFREELRATAPEVVFLGNSVLAYSTDASLFTKLSGRRTVCVSRGGSASAWWYLALKNVILKTPERPQWVVVFFRDRVLTDPGFRATGQYKRAIDEMATSREPILDRLAYRRAMNGVTYCLLRHCPLYQRRDAIKRRIDSHIKKKVTALLGGTGCGNAHRAVRRVFAETNMDDRLLTMSQLTAEARLARENGRFAEQLNRSFLPHMIALARENKVRIAFVRMKRRRDAATNREPAALRAYMCALQSYLAENGAPLIDLTRDSRITLDSYGTGDHFRPIPEVRRYFTELLVERLTPIFSMTPKMIDRSPPALAADRGLSVAPCRFAISR